MLQTKRRVLFLNMMKALILLFLVDRMGALSFLNSPPHPSWCSYLCLPAQSKSDIVSLFCRDTMLLATCCKVGGDCVAAFGLRRAKPTTNSTSILLPLDWRVVTYVFKFYSRQTCP